MQTTTVQQLLDKQANHQTLGHLIYLVRDGALVFYVGQSRRDVVTRFAEHLQKPSRLGQLIDINTPESSLWQVDFYTLADCRPYVGQKSLFAMQAWEQFDMDMAEQALIAHFRPVLNADFNPNPTPLPPQYRGQALVAGGNHETAVSPTERIWLNRMGLQGWQYERAVDGRITHWRHRNGRRLTDSEMAPYRAANQIPQ
jgi:hypothetical protein